MKSLIAVAACWLFLAGPLWGQGSEPNPCALMTKAEVATIFGELKGEPKPDTGVLEEKQCGYENVKGSWLKLSVYPSDRWGMRKFTVSEMNPETISGLGEEAFRVKRGIEAEVYVRKGEWILEVRSSSGRAITQKIAEVAAKKMP
ncbi:MAG: hypothetical protein ABJB32_06030 [Verrucomicrobiota bacterium]